MAKTDLSDLEKAYKKMYEGAIERMAAQNRFIVSGLPKSTPGPWYTRLNRRLRWLAYAPHRWLHRNCNQ